MKYFDPPAIILFFVVSMAGILQHFMLLQLNTEWSLRLVQAVLIGFGYDLMNGAILGLLALLTPLPISYRKILFGMIGTVFLGFMFTDYNYVILFGTHLPFSSYEYINDSGAFWSSAINVVKSLEFFLLFLFPTVLLILLLRIFGKEKVSFRSGFIRRTISLLILFLIGGGAASYSNSYVSKNMENPLTSAALQYFYLTKDREPEEKILRPVKSLSIVKSLVPGLMPYEEKWSEYPLVRIRESNSCTSHKRSKLSKKLCQTNKRPNILIILLESFRAAEIGVYGSKLRLTPEFDRLSKQGVIFKNFYANGFQTRHGLVATYCSLFPNYGAAVMKRYARNNFLCLPEVLKKLGYSTSWVYGSDANFDGQSTFLPKIGFEKIIDEFDYSDSAVSLGWGLSDEELFKKWVSVLDNEKQPFFSSALTITNHHPFEVPDEYKLHQGESVKDRFREAVYYTDAMLGKFISQISKKPWFKNTFVIITADTSSFQPSEGGSNNFEEFVKIRSQVPLLILSGESISIGKSDRSMVITQPASQVELAPTILDLLAEKITVPWVGRSLLAPMVDSLPDIPLRAYTNRPGAYWGVIGEKNRYFQENNKIDHYFGSQNKNNSVLLKEEGSSWHKIIRWVLQENLVWPEKKI